jgi:hypothetical protein
MRFESRYFCAILTIQLNLIAFAIRCGWFFRQDNRDRGKDDFPVALFLSVDQGIALGKTA